MNDHQNDDMLLGPEDAFEPGFNTKTIVAALFIGFIMLPGAMYLSLVSGTTIAGAAQWVTIILFIEVAKRSFVQLRKQEIYIIYIIAGGLIAPGVVMGATGLVLSGGMFGAKIWDQYFIQSPYAASFEIRDLIPRWVVPPADSEALFQRTFFHRDWILPIIILVLHQLLFHFNQIGLGYTLFRMTSDVEKLPFPLASVAAEGAMALAESSGKKETWRWRVFSIGSMIGVVFGAFYVAIPTITGLFMVEPLMLIPIPFVDFTAKIGTFLPAAMFGFFTDLSAILAGFILPFWVVIGMVAGCLGSRVVMNPILHKFGFLDTWRPGMGVIPTKVTTDLDFWLSIVIGVGIVVGVVGVWTVAKAFFKRGDAGTAGARAELPRGRGDMPIWLALGIWLLSTIAYVILCGALVGWRFVWIFCFFGFFMTPFLSYISARMFGITGSLTGIQFPMLIEGSFILSGYKGVDIWFAPVPYFNHGGLAQFFKQLELTRTKFTCWYKAIALSFVIMAFCSFLFWSLIWRFGPIPSSRYPFVQKMWPLYATMKALWASATVSSEGSWMLDAIKFKLIAVGAVGGGVLYFLTLISGLPMQLFYGIVGGVSMWPHHVFPMLLGALLGRYFFAPRFGPKKWKSYTPVLLAGYGCGMGLVGMAAIGLALIAKSVSQLVF